MQLLICLETFCPYFIILVFHYVALIFLLQNSVKLKILTILEPNKLQLDDKTVLKNNQTILNPYRMSR